jgi:hypothetical protein
MRSLVTNDVHTDAPQPILKALSKDTIEGEMIQPAGHLKVQIMGKYISMLMVNIVISDGMTGDYLQVWDWTSKNGYQVNRTNVTS